MEKNEILKTLKEEKIDYLQMQFIDIFGICKHVEVPKTQFEKAVNGDVMFDGSSIDGFTRIEESDMLLIPDYKTFRIFPWEDESGKVARLICDVHNPDGTPFKGCPRFILKQVVKEAEKLGYYMVVGPEAEFFLFYRNGEGEPTLKTHDKAGYFDMAPQDLGSLTRRDIVKALEKLEFEVEAAHHEVADGQHEIDFKYDDVISTADNVITFKLVVKKIASKHGLHATFMPKPVFGINGSGMHCHQSLFDKNGNNLFHDPKDSIGLSKLMRQYIAGILKHAKGMCAITNPLVNSYKRLVPGYEAPINLAWSEKNRSPLIRIPASRGKGTRMELRMPDPTCNPYLSFAVMLKSGLDGIKNKMTPPDPVDKNVFTMSEREKRRYRIDALPPNLRESLHFLKKDDLLTETLGDHIFNHFYNSKVLEWNNYISRVHSWEHDRYFELY